MIDEKDAEKLTKSLLKKAIGYTVDEVVEEYVNSENAENLHLIKRKITKKHIPPDISAVKTLLETTEDNFEKYRKMSDEELLKKRDELLKQISKGGSG